MTSATAPNLRRHFTDAEIVSALRFALQAVQEVGPPKDLRLAVFNAAWGMRGMYYQGGSSVRTADSLGIVNGG